MKTKLITPIVMLFFLLVGPIQAAETPPVVDIFSCTLASGKSAKDVDSAVSFWNQQADKIDNESLNQYSAWMVTPIRSSNPSDFYWLGASPNMNTWAKGNAAYAGSNEGQAAQARFDKISSCTSETWSSEILYGTQPSADNTSAVLEGYGCNLLEGKTMSNVRAVEANYIKELKKAGVEMNIFRLSPLYTDTQADLVYLVGHDDMETLGATGTKIGTTPGTATGNRYFNLVMDCAAGLYNIETIRSGTAAD